MIRLLAALLLIPSLAFALPHGGASSGGGGSGTISLSSNVFDTTNASTGYTIGTLSSTGTCSGSYTLTGTDAAKFAVSGSNFNTKGTLTPNQQSSYSVTVNQGGCSQAETLTLLERPGPSAALYANPYYTCTTNYYVATTGSDSNSGTQAQNPATPWLTLQHANNTVPTVTSGNGSICINVANGTYSGGVTVSAGGFTASSIGYLVYRCATLNGCTITATTGWLLETTTVGTAGVFPYIIIDGFTMTSPTQTGNGNGVVLSDEGSNTPTVVVSHHIWVINSVISGYGQSGLQLNDGEYLFAIHNTTFNNSQAANCDGGAQGSGISFAGMLAVSPYTRTADDANNVMTGNIGATARNVINWNVTYNNYIVGGSCSHTDGNGIIADTWNWTGIGAGVDYTGGGIIAFNVAYNNGGAGVSLQESDHIIVANNSTYNNFLDTANTGTGKGMIGVENSFSNLVFNNIAVAIPGASGNTENNSATITYPNGSTTTTLSAAITTTSATSISVTSGASFPSSGNFMVGIGSELLLVTAGQGTTTWTVTRGYLGTTAATHLISATTTWSANIWSTNISKNLATSLSGENVVFNGDVYATTGNKTNTSPSWVNVGNTSPGTMSTQPNGANFGLNSGSAAIGYGATQTYLSGQSVDLGACPHLLATCP